VFRLAATVPDAEVIPIGKRACERWEKPVVSSEKFPATEAKKLADELCRDYLAGKFGKLGILYTRYRSMMSQEATLLWVLPLDKQEADGETAQAAPIFEPNEQTVLNAAVPTYISGLLAACIRESYACEVAARRMAMDSAGKNAQEMIDNLQLQYNRARQNSITQEITEIVAGSGL
jgi:F-type H+-transporting ATPase subunit gamma